MPSVASKTPPRAFSGEIVLSGSLGWKIKARDLDWFAEITPAIAKRPLLPKTWYVTEGFRRREAPIELLSDKELPNDEQLRIGIIADRFIAGFKMKSLWYIANNCLVFSFADIRDEFAGLPGAEICVSYVRDQKEFEKRLDDLFCHPQDELLQAFVRFKSACFSRFDWREQTKHLLQN